MNFLTEIKYGKSNVFKYETEQLNHTSMGLGEFKGRFQQFFGVIYQSFVCVGYLF